MPAMLLRMVEKLLKKCVLRMYLNMYRRSAVERRRCFEDMSELYVVKGRRLCC